MAGHSKWANIKHRKGAQDAKRGKIFTKILKEVTVAARMGGGDPSGNPRLRIALDKARSNNVPKDNVERAIKRGTGELEGVNYEEYSYEGYAPAGVAVLVEVLTDNKNRTGGEVRNIFSKGGGNLAEPGAVAWNFERKGEIIITGADEDIVMDSAIEAGADDVEVDGDEINVYTAAEDFMDVKEALEGQFTISSAEITMVAKNTVKIEDSPTANSIFKVLDKLEDHDDVQKVYSNVDMDPSLLEED